MKEIKLNSCPRLRGNVVQAVVDEERLEFRNEISVAQAEVNAIDYYGNSYSYQCVGLINEDFLEVYDGVTVSALMFLPYNKEIIRFGDCDFIVAVNCGEDDRDWLEYHHVKIIDGEACLMNDRLGECQRVNNPFLTITGKNKRALYDIKEGKFLTPYVANVRMSENAVDCFDVISQVKVEFEDEYELIDYLYFRINSKGETVSDVFSCLDHAVIDCYLNLSVDDVLLKRREELSTKMDNFEKVVNEANFIYSKK